MNKLAESTVTIILAVIGIGVVALLVSNSANTGSVFGSIGTALSNSLGCALSPITGKQCSQRSLTPDVHSTLSFPG